MSTDKLRQQFKGQLYKYTNVVKGWQYRWFILAPETGILDYYVTDSQRKQRPRGSVHLAAAVISPSDEDSNTFTVNSASGEVFKLQAADARERQEWVNRLRAVAEMHTMAIAQSNPPLPPREHHHSVPLQHSAPTAQGPRVHCTLAVLDAFSTARENLQKAEQSNEALARIIDNLPSSGPRVTNVDPELLLLKATSQATIACLGQCLSILQHQQIAPAAPSRAVTHPALSNKKNLPSHYLPPQPFDLNDRKSLTNSESTTPGNGPSSYRPLTVPREAETIAAEDELTDNEQNTENVCSYEEHNTLLRLASHTKRGTDLTRVVLPTFLLEPRSLLEMLADFWGHSDLLLKITSQVNEHERMIAVLQWYLTSFHLGLNLHPGKKPYNPLLGETFHCSWKVKNSNSDPYTVVRFTAEQVAHQPPVSAFYVECLDKKLYVNGYISPKSIFTGMSVDVTLVGEVNVYLGEHNEKYDITLPTVHARSIISKPWVQLGGKVNINCYTTNLTASITHPKSFFGDKPHQVIGEVKDSNSCIICKFQGDWKNQFKFTYPNNTSNMIDVSTLEVFQKRVRKLGDQSAYESRNLWKDVSSSLHKGDVAMASTYRVMLEEQQRLEFVKQQEAGLEVPATYFNQINEDSSVTSSAWCYKKLLDKI